MYVAVNILTSLHLPHVHEDAVWIMCVGLKLYVKA